MPVVIKRPNIKTDEGHTFVDLNLYLSEFNRNSLRYSPTLKSRDLVTSKDFVAIANSMRNILTTRPGERPLVPLFGTDLERFLFQPLDEDTAKELSRSIITSIEQWDPRVVVNTVNTFIDFDNNEYVITLSISVPVLDVANEDFYINFEKDRGIYFKQDPLAAHNVPPRYPFGFNA